ncbi:hypothetical protein J6590_023673 [Homalodisca vitripennis]|nr:hypothetical protein J6590_023673 [Homalodisca vitripennis]
MDRQLDELPFDFLIPKSIVARIKSNRCSQFQVSTTFLSRVIAMTDGQTVGGRYDFIKAPYSWKSVWEQKGSASPVCKYRVRGANPTLSHPHSPDLPRHRPHIKHRQWSEIKQESRRPWLRKLHPHHASINNIEQVMATAGRSVLVAALGLLNCPVPSSAKPFKIGLHYMKFLLPFKILENFMSG